MLVPLVLVVRDSVVVAVCVVVVDGVREGGVDLVAQADAVGLRERGAEALCVDDDVEDLVRVEEAVSVLETGVVAVGFGLAEADLDRVGVDDAVALEVADLEVDMDFDAVEVVVGERDLAVVRLGILLALADRLLWAERDPVEVGLLVWLATPEWLAVEVAEGDLDARAVTLFAGDAVVVFVVDILDVVVRVEVLVRETDIVEVVVRVCRAVAVVKGDAVDVLEGSGVGDAAAVGLIEIDASPEGLTTEDESAVRVDVEVRVELREAVDVRVGRTWSPIKIRLLFAKAKSPNMINARRIPCSGKDIEWTP